MHGCKTLEAPAFRLGSSHTSDTILSIDFSPAGEYITGGVGSEIVIWETSTGFDVENLVGHASDIIHIVWSPDGQLIASVDQDRVLRVWPVELTTTTTSVG